MTHLNTANDIVSRSDGIVINRGDLIDLLAATYDLPKNGLAKAALRLAQAKAQDALAFQNI